MLYQKCQNRAAVCLLSEYNVLERSKNRASVKERKENQNKILGKVRKLYDLSFNIVHKFPSVSFL